MGIEKVKESIPFLMDPVRFRQDYDPTPLNLTNVGDIQQLQWEATNLPDQDTSNDPWDMTLGSIARAYRNRGELSVFHWVDNDFRQFENMYFEHPLNEGTLTDALLKGGINPQNPAVGMQMMQTFVPNFMGHVPEFDMITSIKDPDFKTQEVFDLMPKPIQRILARNGVSFESDFKNINSLEAFDFTLSWHLYGIWASQTYEARAGFGTKVQNFFGGLAYDPITALEVGGGIAATSFGTPVAGAAYDIAIGGVLEGVRGYYANDGSSTLAQLTNNPQYMDDPTFADVAWGSTLGVAYGVVGYGLMKGVSSGFKYTGRKIAAASEDALNDATLIGANREAADVGIRMIQLEDEFARTASGLGSHEYNLRRRALLGELLDTQDVTRVDMEMLVTGNGTKHLKTLKENAEGLGSKYRAAQVELAQAHVSITKKAEASKSLGAEIARLGKAVKKTQRELVEAEAKSAIKVTKTTTKKIGVLTRKVEKTQTKMADLRASRSTAAGRLEELRGPQAKLQGLTEALTRNARSVGAVQDAVDATPALIPTKASDDIGEQIGQIAEVGATQDIIRSGNVYGRSLEWIGERVPFLKDKMLMVQTLSRDQGKAFRSGMALVNWRANLGGLANNLTQRGVLNHRQAFRTIDAQMKRYGQRAVRAVAAVKAHRSTVTYAQYNKDLQAMWGHIMHDTSPDSATMREAITEIKSLMADLHAEGKVLQWNFGSTHFPLASWNKSLIKESQTEYVDDLTRAFRETLEASDSADHLKRHLKKLNEFDAEWKLASIKNLSPDQERVLVSNLHEEAFSSKNRLLGFSKSGGTPKANRKLNRGFSKSVQQHALMDQYYNKDVLKDLYDYMHDPLVYELATRAALKDQMGLVLEDGVGALEQLDKHIIKYLDKNMVDLDRGAFAESMKAIQGREAAQYRRRFSGYGGEASATDAFANTINNMVGAAKGAYWGMAAISENAQAFMNHLGADWKRFPALMEMMFRGLDLNNLKHTPAMLERYIMHNRFLMEMGHDAGGFMMENSLSPAGHFRNSSKGLRGLSNAAQGHQGGGKFWAVAEASTGGLRHFAIESGWLRGVTNMGKDFSIASHMDYMLTRTAKIRSYKASLDAAFPAGHSRTGREALKVQRGLARKSGLDFEFTEWWAEKNLLSDEVFEPLMEILENKAFRYQKTFANYLDFDKVNRWVHEPGALRSTHRNAANQLKEYLDFMAGHEIATPNAWDALSPDRENWLSKLTFSLTTFPRAFASRTISRLATMPAGRAAVTFGTLGTAELMYLYSRRLLAGEKLEDINEEFSADPSLFVTTAFARTPILGPWGYDILNLGKYTAGAGRFDSPLSGAGLSQMERLIRAGTNGASFVYDWENAEIDDSTIELGTNLIPLVNNWVFRTGIRMAEAMEASDGPVRGVMDTLRLNSRASREATVKTVTPFSDVLDIEKMTQEYQADYNTMVGLETVIIPEQFKDIVDN